MFVSNIEDVSQKGYYKCGKVIGKYLIKKGIPLLSYEDKVMIFAKTKKLQKAIQTMPFLYKLLLKVGVING